MSTETLNQSAGSRDYEDFKVPGHEFATVPFTVLSGQVLAANEVVGRHSSTGKISTYGSTSGNGLNTAYAIAVDAVDASAGDIVAYFYVKGVFNQNKLVFSDTGDSVTAGVFNDLRTRGIVLVDSVGA